MTKSITLHAHPPGSECTPACVTIEETWLDEDESRWESEGGR